MVSEKNNVMSDAALYKQLQWIESTGTQYIDTGVAVTTSTGFELDVKEFKSTAFGCFGCMLPCNDQSAAAQDRWTRFQVGRRDNVVGSTKLFWGIWTRNYYNTTTTIDYSKEHVFRYIPQQSPNFYVDSTTHAIGNYTPTNDKPFYYYLFASMDHSSYGTPVLFCSAVLRHAKLYDNG